MAPATGYKTLIYDCMGGDANLFQRAAKIEAGWQAVRPILDAWDANPTGLPPARLGESAEVVMTTVRRILLSDVDGKLVTEEKVLTDRARAVVQRLHHRGNDWMGTKADALHLAREAPAVTGEV